MEQRASAPSFSDVTNFIPASTSPNADDALIFTYGYIDFCIHHLPEHCACNVTYPRWNGEILTVAQIIKFVMASAAKAELDALFIAAQKILLLHQTLIEMG